MSAIFNRVKNALSDETNSTVSIRDDESFGHKFIAICDNLFTAISHPISSCLVEHQSKGAFDDPNNPNEQQVLTTTLWDNRRAFDARMVELPYEFIPSGLVALFDSKAVPKGEPIKMLLGACELGYPYSASGVGICVAVVIHKAGKFDGGVNPITEEPIVEAPQGQGTPCMVGWADMSLIDPIGQAADAKSWLSSVAFTVDQITGGARNNFSPQPQVEEPMDDQRLARIAKLNGVDGLNTA